MGRNIEIEPSNLQINEYSGRLVLFSSIWSFSSPDLRTHYNFCDILDNFLIFNFSNMGKSDYSDPSCIDDGKDDCNWLALFLNVLSYLKFDYTVIINYKSLMYSELCVYSKSGLRFIDVCWSTAEKARLVSTYMHFIDDMLCIYGVKHITEFFDAPKPYNYVVTDRLYVDINNRRI